MEGQELSYIGPGKELQLARDPDEIIKDAHKAANKLMEIIENQKTQAIVITIGAGKHLKLEAWEIIGSFYGMSGRIVSCERNQDFETIDGYNAKAEVFHVASEKLISSAEAMCLNDEEKWDKRPIKKYCYVLKSGPDRNSEDPLRREGLSIEDPGMADITWIDNPKKPGKKMPKKEEKIIGEADVPMFQLKSMAQTRALSKAYSIALRWVVILAGYNPTPAEELPEDMKQPIEDDDREPSQEHEQTSGSGQTSTAGGDKQTATTQKKSDGGVVYITGKQISNIWNMAYEPNEVRSSLTPPQAKALLASLGYENISMIPQTEYERVLARMKSGELEPGK
jgi:hypothetical protein